MTPYMRQRAVTDCPICDTLTLTVPAPIMLKEPPALKRAPGLIRSTFRAFWNAHGPARLSPVSSIFKVRI